MRVAIFCLLVVMLSQASVGRHVCRRDVDYMKYQLRLCIFGRRIAHTIRLVFHDCVGDTCDGCLNFNHPFNTGAWSETVRLLNDLYVNQGFDQYVSYADYYTLAGIVAIEEGVRNANWDLPYWERVPVPRIKFQVGREDCPTAPEGTVNQDLPSGNLDHWGINEFFELQFGFDTTETVAIMGGHTVGGATGRVNGAGSGWLGFWKENAYEANKFDNRYYTMLVNPQLNWIHLDKAPVTGFFLPRWQWEGFDCYNNLDSFMLNADVATFLKIDVNADGMSSCDFDTCPKSTEGLQAVNDYANSFFDFLNDFEDVYDKMTKHGLSHTQRLRNPRSC